MLTTDGLDLARMLDAYMVCALWSSADEEGRPLDGLYDAGDIARATREEMRDDCRAFMADNAADLEALNLEQAGHDFWLTRNRHGAGFWDRGLGAVGERLSDAARVYGTVDLYVGADGRVHA